MDLVKISHVLSYLHLRIFFKVVSDNYNRWRVVGKEGVGENGD